MNIEASFRRVIRTTPAAKLFDGHGILNTDVDLRKVVKSWSKAEAAQCAMLLRWAQPKGMIHKAHGAVTLHAVAPIRPTPAPAPRRSSRKTKLRASGQAPLAGPVASISGYVYPSGNIVPFSNQACQDLFGTLINDVQTAWWSNSDAIQRLQVANDRLVAAKTDYQQIDLQQPNIGQLNSDLNDMSAALVLWQQDRDSALAAIADASANAACCIGSSAVDQDGRTLQDWAAEARAFGTYFTDPNVLLEVATLSQQFQAMWQLLVTVAQQAQQQIALRQYIQALSGEIASGISFQSEWWGLKLILDENSTQKLESLLQQEIDDGFKTAAGAIASLPYYGPLTAILWTIVIIESALVLGDIVDTDKGVGVTLNVSWIPLGATVLADITSGGSLTPEIVNLVELAEEATLMAEATDPGFGNQWYSFFWITPN